MVIDINFESFNCEYVLNVIANLKESFEKEIFPKYNKNENNEGLTRRFENFYTCGHGISFARIMKEIFGDMATIYDNFLNDGSIVIVKIGEHYYDADGIVDYLVEYNPKDFNESLDGDLAFYEDFLNNKHENDEEIKNDLIVIGKNSLQEMLNNHSEALKRKLTN